MSRNERIVYIALGLVIWIYLIIRAFSVPLVHDEVACFFNYYQHFEWLPYDAMWDAGNHFLNTFLTSCSVHVFGDAPFAIRLASLLFFPVYVLGMVRLAGRLNETISRVFLIAVLYGTSFVVEFFALSRGYGICFSLLIWSIYSFWDYIESARVRSLVGFSICSTLSLSASLTVLPLVALMFLILLVQGYRLTTIRLFVHGVHGFFIGGFGLLALQMKSLGLLYYGNKEGFYDTTVSSLVEVFLGGLSWYWSMILCLAVLVGISYLIIPKQKREMSLAGLLVGVIIVVIGLSEFLGANYPEDRAGLYIYILVVVVIAKSLDMFSGFVSKAIRVLPFAAIVIASLVSVNVNHSVFWGVEMMPHRFYEKVVKDGKETTVHGYHIRNLSYAYWNYCSESVYLTNDDFPNESNLADYLVTSNQSVVDHELYDSIDYERSSQLVLFERRQKLHKKFLKDFSVDWETSNSKEFVISGLDSSTTYYLAFEGELKKDFIGRNQIEISEVNESRIVNRELYGLQFFRPKNIQFQMLSDGNYGRTQLKIRMHVHRKQKSDTLSGRFLLYELE